MKRCHMSTSRFFYGRNQGDPPRGPNASANTASLSFIRRHFRFIDPSNGFPVWKGKCMDC
jgi:hypothetical protein